jgi:hypothetical protein
MGIMQGGASTPAIPNVELGLADARLLSVDTKMVTGGDFGDGFIYTYEDEAEAAADGHKVGDRVNRFQWNYLVLDDEGEPLYDEESGDQIIVDQLTGLQFFAKAKNLSKQTRAMKALLTPAEFEAWAEGEDAPSIKELVGRKVQVDIGLNGKGYPTVSNVLAARKARSGSRRISSADDEA